ncbi:MAG: peptide chain release factor N(5)-glutamine methyltransferase [Actinobacteria bacterium]|nr:peptide chain release factor N(5)-glutamine methyltransferase [Actinomycetota bacterium]
MHLDRRLRSDAVARLAAAGCVSATEEAELLVAAARDRHDLDSFLRRRVTGEPIGWIIGSTDFGGLTIGVIPGVYVPRPHTEVLADRAAATLADVARSRTHPVRAADLCTGSGAIAARLSDAVPDALVVGVDIDPIAVMCARSNGVDAIIGDLGAPLRSGSFDVVTVVAPYVPTADLDLLPADVRRYEPVVALDGGPTGLGPLERVIDDAASLLRPGGGLFLEAGGDQLSDLRRLLDAAGFDGLTPWFDEEGDLRGLEVRHTGSGTS